MLRPLALLLALATCPLFAVVSGGGTVVSGPHDGNDFWREGQTAPASFGVLDANGDGTVSRGEYATAHMQFATELKQAKSSLIAAVDLDQSGKLSRYEAAEGSPRWNSLRERARELAIAANDKNGNGKVDSDEAGGLEERIGKIFVRYGVARVDKDQNKNFSRSEVQTAIDAIKGGKGAMFTLCDVTNDGLLSVREAEMAFDILAAAAGL